MSKSILSGAACMLFCYALNARTAKPADTLTFIHVSDVHVCNMTGYDPAFVNQRQQFLKSAETFSEFLKTVPDRYNADFIVVTGDNIDYYGAETEQGNILETQVEQYADLLDQSEIPVYITLGNHDIGSYRASSATTYSSTQVVSGEARASWMRNVPCLKDGTYYSRTFKIDTVTIRMIFLDNSYNATTEIYDGVLPFIVDQYQLQWLDSQLSESSTDIEIIFMHIPVPYGQGAEGKMLSEQLSAFASKSKYYNLLSVLEKRASARLIFAGHKHINNVNEYIFGDGNRMTQVMTGAYAYEPANWRLVKITGDKILISSPGKTGAELIIPFK